MNIWLYYGILVFVLLIGIIIFYFTKRNYFNKYKYIRLVIYNRDKTIDIKYPKRKDFAQNNEILVNSNHVFDYKGYKTIIITSEASEAINPLDFSAKYDAKKYKTAIRSDLIQKTFGQLTKEKFDKMMLLIGINVLQLIVIAYLLYSTFGAN